MSKRGAGTLVTRYGSAWLYIRQSEGESLISRGKEPFHTASCRNLRSLDVVIDIQVGKWCFRELHVQMGLVIFPHSSFLVF